jgi:plastocyanin
LVWLAVTVAAMVLPSAAAVHFYRGPGGGCTEANGALTDDPPGGTGPEGAIVTALHNSFADASNLAPLTFVDAGQAVTWKWASLHCHSITAGRAGVGSGQFESGVHYPTEAGSVPLLPGLFHYPLPSLDPQLSFTHTLTEPGTYSYYCVHHWMIGMQGVVVVEAA